MPEMWNAEYHISLQFKKMSSIHNVMQDHYKYEQLKVKFPSDGNR